MAARKIIQIMPAPGWAARIVEGDDEYETPLVGWALVQEGSGTAVVGLIAGKQVEMCDSDPGFAGYAYVAETLSDTLQNLEDELDDIVLDDDEDDAPPHRSSRLN
ncbi:MAG: hypothetical protein ACT4QE_05355 [Anaerolineales bacterium]